MPGFPHLKVACKFATEHRCGVSIRWGGKGSSSSAGDSQVSSSNRNRRLVDKVAGTDPLKDGRPLARSVPLDSSADAAFTSAAINAVSERFFEVLSSHPINVARREQGQPPVSIGSSFPYATAIARSFPSDLLFSAQALRPQLQTHIAL